jgi:hypothetical protein
VAAPDVASTGNSSTFIPIFAMKAEKIVRGLFRQIVHQARTF